MQITETGATQTAAVVRYLWVEGPSSHAFNWWMTHEPEYQDGWNIHAWTILGQYYKQMGVGVIYYQHDGVTRKFYTVDFVR